VTPLNLNSPQALNQSAMRKAVAPTQITNLSTQSKASINVYL